jgi:hypothetical protein
MGGGDNVGAFHQRSVNALPVVLDKAHRPVGHVIALLMEFVDTTRTPHSSRR